MVQKLRFGAISVPELSSENHTHTHKVLYIIQKNPVKSKMIELFIGNCAWSNQAIFPWNFSLSALK